MLDHCHRFWAIFQLLPLKSVIYWIFFAFLVSRKRPAISPKKAGRIISLHQYGLSQREIVAELKRTKQPDETIPGQSAVCKILHKFAETGSVKKREGQGRPRITTEREDRQIVRIAKSNRKTSLKRLSNESSDLLKKSISRFTIRRRLKEQGFKVCRCTKKPLVSGKNRKKRFNWARKNQDQPIEYWNKVEWSDESRFEFVSDRPQSCIRRSDERFRPDCMQTTAKHGGGGLMVWGSFSANGVGELHRINGIVKAKDYIDILKKSLLPTIRKRQNSGIVFQQDNAPCHKAEKVIKWFDDHNIDWIDDWPAQSPDINPIENLWDYIDRKIRDRVYSNADELWAAIETVWKDIPIAFCEKLASSVPRRLVEVIKNKGGPTKY